MIHGVDHIGVAVNDLHSAMELYTTLFGVAEFHRERVDDQGVDIASFTMGSIRIELTAATRPDSPIARFIEKRGEGIHHVAFKTDNILDDLRVKEEQGIRLVDRVPRNGAHNMLIAFLHPASTGGVLMELCADKPDVHETQR